MRPGCRAALALLLLLPLSSCLGPPPSHALVVRNLEGKCALIAFSGCGALYGTEPERAAGDDAAGDEDAGVE